MDLPQALEFSWFLYSLVGFQAIPFVWLPPTSPKTHISGMWIKEAPTPYPTLCKLGRVHLQLMQPPQTCSLGSQVWLDFSSYPPPDYVPLSWAERTQHITVAMSQRTLSILNFLAVCLNMLLFFFFKFIYLLINLFLAVLGLRFCARAFSSCGEWGPLFIAVRGPLTIVPFLVAEHRLQMRRLSSCGPRARDRKSVV